MHIGRISSLSYWAYPVEEISFQDYLSHVEVEYPNEFGRIAMLLKRKDFYRHYILVPKEPIKKRIESPQIVDQAFRELAEAVKNIEDTDKDNKLLEWLQCYGLPMGVNKGMHGNIYHFNNRVAPDMVLERLTEVLTIQQEINIITDEPILFGDAAALLSYIAHYICEVMTIVNPAQAGITQGQFAFIRRQAASFEDLSNEEAKQVFQTDPEAVYAEVAEGLSAFLGELFPQNIKLDLDISNLAVKPYQAYSLVVNEMSDIWSLMMLQVISALSVGEGLRFCNFCGKVFKWSSLKEYYCPAEDGGRSKCQQAQALSNFKQKKGNPGR